MTTEKNQRVAFLEKVNALRAESCTKDWTNNGIMTIQGRNIRYIGITQMKANLAPLFAKHRLEFKVDMTKPEFLGTITTSSGNTVQHWLCGLEVQILDTESDETLEYTFYGEGSDSLDKAIDKAVTFALKQFFKSVLLVADGMDLEDGDEPVKSSFKPLAPAQEKQVKQQIASHATPPATPAPKAEEKAEFVQPPAGSVKVELTPVIIKAIDNAIRKNKTMLDNGQITQEEYDQMITEKNNLSSIDVAKDFIKKYKRV